MPRRRSFSFELWPIVGSLDPLVRDLPLNLIHFFVSFVPSFQMLFQASCLKCLVPTPMTFSHDADHHVADDVSSNSLVKCMKNVSHDTLEPQCLDLEYGR